MKEKKTRGKKFTAPVAKEKKATGTIGKPNAVELVIVLLYAATELVPRLDAVDVMGGQWLYLSVLNCLATIWLFKTKKLIPNRFFKSALFIGYGGFIVIAGLSFFVAYNVIESLVVYSRWLICLIAFLNLLSFIYHDSKILKSLFYLLGMLVFVQALQVLIEFFSNFSHVKNVSLLINDLTLNAGNKNILAASMVIKIPFLIYSIHHSRTGGKIFFLVALFLSLAAIFIVNARASFVGLFLEMGIYFALLVFSFLKSGKKINAFKLPALLTGIFIMAAVSTQLFFSSLEKQNKVVGYGGLTKRIESIGFTNEGSSERMLLWSNAFDFIKKNPILGGGCGNWKIHSGNYERFWQPGFGQSINHPHNDFIEVSADTGIPGGLFYASVFMFLFWYTFLLLKSPAVSQDKKMIVAAAIMSFAAYFVDSVFNFPMERPNIQILFAVSAAIICFVYIDYKRSTQEKDISVLHKKILVPIIVLSIVTLYISSQVFRSMRVQSRISMEWIGLPRESKVPFKADDINPSLPWIPNINGSSMPIACVKAKYLCQEKRYDEALAILNEDKHSNPYLYFGEFLRSMIALSLNQNDSAYYYAKYAYYNRPANLQLFDYLSGLAVDRKDTIELEKAFKEVTRRFPRPDLWIKYSDYLFECNGNDEKRMELILDGLKKYPQSNELIFKKNFVEGLKFFKIQSYEQSVDHFKEALKYKSGDQTTEQNIGLAYINLKRFNEAIPYFTDVITNGSDQKGKGVYYRGMCYQNIGKRDSACADFKAANSLGYKLDPLLLEGCR